MNKNKLEIWIYLLSALFCVSNTYAQDSLTTTYSRKKLLQENQWLNTTNIAGQVFNPFQPEGDFVAEYSLKEGDLRYQQHSPKESIYHFYTQKSKRVNNIVFKGGFSYNNMQQKKVGWTARMNPISHNPYMLADSLFGTYKKDYVALNGGFAAKLSKRLALGINLDYMVGDGARIKDPRPSNSTYELKASPSFIYSFDNAKLGANFQFIAGREKISYSTAEHSTSYRFFRTLGLGKAGVPTNGWSYSRNYYTKGYGGELQGQSNIGNKQILIGFGYYYKIEEAEDGSASNPRKGDVGDYKESVLKFYTLITQNKQLNHRLLISADAYFGTGIEFLQKPYEDDGITYYRTIAELENYSLTQITPKLQYVISKPFNNFMNKWEVSANLGADIFQSEYKSEAKSSYTNLNANIEIFKNLFFSKNNFMDFTISGFINYNIAEELKQLSPYNAIQEIALWDNLIQPDFNLVTGNQYGSNISVRFGHNLKIRKGKSNFMYIALNMSYFWGENDAWTRNRDFKQYGVKIGVLY